jgi:TPR repeat protein/tRNA A-37 threonylcarbamoyl transferase component Bud32
MRKKKRHINALKPGYKLHWYEIDSILGEGGFGITYLARDINLDHEVAIKEYFPRNMVMREDNGSVHTVNHEQDDRYHWGLERFLEEAQTIGKFKHPNIVRVRNVFEENNTAYMVMDYELGESFQEILNQRKTLDEEDIRTIIIPIIDGMKVVHAAGFIHRDIKPANIFLRVDGDPVLLDFGSARTSFEENKESLTSIFSRGYAPIEQYHTTEESQGPWTDIYALGATIYRAIVGVAPTDAVDRSAAIAQIGRDTYVTVVEIAAGKYSHEMLIAVDYALQFKLQDRPQTVSEWRSAFDKATKSANEIDNNTVDKTETEPDNMVESFRQAAGAGDINAQSSLGFMYAKGIGTEKDNKEAIKWYRMAAEQGHLNSQFNLGVMYAKGRGVEQNYTEAYKWYKMAADQGDVASQATLGKMCKKGIGTDKNHKEAINWFHKAAVQGHLDAQYNVAKMFAKGQGVPADEEEGFQWYLKAAEQGHIGAQINLAFMHGKGQGVPRNDTEAFHWFRKAAEQGHPNAQYNLGVIYAKGRGIAKNIDEAKKWYGKAAAQGDENAERVLSRLEQQ